MKIFYLFILGLGLCGVMILPLACGKNISPTSSGSTPTPTISVSATPTATATSSISFTSAYQNSVYPTSSYSGELDAWLSGQFVQTSEGSAPYLKVTTGMIGRNAYTRSVIKFSGINLPSNASVLGAEVWLTTETTTNVSGSVTVGVHSFASSVYPSCASAWTTLVTWEGPGDGSQWYTCDGDPNDGNNFGLYNFTPNSTVVFSSTVNGSTRTYRFILNTSDVQNEISSGIVQFILRSEGEFSGDTGTSLIGFYPNTDTTGKAPKLLISYQ